MAQHPNDDRQRQEQRPGAGPAAQTPQQDHTPRQEEHERAEQQRQTGGRNVSPSRVRLRAVRAADEQPHGDVERLRRGRTREARGADRGDSAGCGARLDPCG